MCDFKELESISNIAVAILSSLLVGGTVMQFFESQHSFKHINEVYSGKMRPFYSKLTKYLIFLTRINEVVKYKDTENEYIQRLIKDISELSKIASDSILSGNDVNFMSNSKISRLCERINDIWYCYENNNITSNVELDFDALDIMRGGIIDSLKTYSLEYANAEIDMYILHKVSGEFYNKVWQPVQNVTWDYEYLQKQQNDIHYLIRLNILISSISLLIILIGYGSIGLFAYIIVAINLFLFICIIFKADRVRQKIQKFV